MIAKAVLGQNIERLREAGGHGNAAKFAREIGVSVTTLNDWESGRYAALRLDSLLKLAVHIPCSVEDILVGVSPQYVASGLSASVPKKVTPEADNQTQNSENTDSAVGKKVAESSHAPPGTTNDDQEFSESAAPDLSEPVELQQIVKRLQSELHAAARDADALVRRSAAAPRVGKTQDLHGAARRRRARTRRGRR